MKSLYLWGVEESPSRPGAQKVVRLWEMSWTHLICYKGGPRDNEL